MFYLWPTSLPPMQEGKKRVWGRGERLGWGRGERLGWRRLQLPFVDVFQCGGNGAHVQLDAPSPVLHIPNFLGRGEEIGG